MNYETARNQMLSQQIRAWDVLDQQVLDTLRNTPRELFVPEKDRDLAFADIEMPLPHGQCMMAPKVEARLLQELAIGPQDAALEIGSGSGYLTACLAKLAHSVTSLEYFADLSALAGSNLHNAGVHNVELRVDDATQASFDRKFDVIAVTAAVPVLTGQFSGLLNPGGRLFVVVGRAPVMQAMLIRLLADGSVVEKSLFETLLTPMINAPSNEAFVL